MGGVVKKVVGGGDKPKPAPTPAPVVTPRGDTGAQQRQAQLRAARRGSGRSLLSYSRTLGEQSVLQGEDMK